MRKVYVLLGRYSDGSGFEVLRALASKERAEQDRGMLARVSMMEVEVIETEYDDWLPAHVPISKGV
jgi:hypothetical protein